MYNIFNDDCMNTMRSMENNSVDLTLTDIPYDMVNRESNGLRNLDKGKADELTFDLHEFLEQVFRVTKGTTIIFCGINQVSDIYKFFADKQKQSKGTVRQIVWEKNNPSPMNGQVIYLSGIENAIWFKKRGGTFNAHCKNTVFKFPCGRSKIHPTEKNHALLKELILDNSGYGDLVFDPCMGSGSHGVVSLENGRRFTGIELNTEWFNIAKQRLIDVEIQSEYFNLDDII